MGQPAARVTDMHTCPMFDGPKPHVGGPLLPPGKPNVLIGGLPAVTVTNMATCVGPPDMVTQGSMAVLIGGLPAARMGDMTAHMGIIVGGYPTVLIGGPTFNMNPADIPAEVFATKEPSLWAIGASMVLDFIPVVGTVKGVIEAFTGEDLITGEKLSPLERALGIIPIVGKLGRVAKGGAKILRGAKAADKVADASKAANRASDAARGANRASDASRAASREVGLGKRATGATDLKKGTPTSDPVDVIGGYMFTENTDFFVHGPIPIVWVRKWFSFSIHKGALGHGWHHNYDMAIKVHLKEVIYRSADGRGIVFPFVPQGKISFNREERMYFIHDQEGYAIRTAENLIYRFKADVGNGVKKLSSIENPNGFKIQFFYNPNGHLEKIIDSANRTLQVNSDATGRIRQIIAPHPEKVGKTFVIANYDYENGELTAFRDALDQKESYEYKDQLITKKTFKDGSNFYFEYQGSGEDAMCTRAWGDGGIYDHKLQYFPAEKKTIVENSIGYRTTYFGNENGLVVKTIDSRKGEFSKVFNEHNEVIEITDSLGNKTSYQYDDWGNTINISSSGGGSSDIEFNEDFLPMFARDASGGNWAWEYDEQLNLVARLDPLGRKTQYYYQKGLLKSVLSPDGQQSNLDYDEFFNLRHFATADGNISSWLYDRLGNNIKMTDPLGNAEWKEYDLLNRITKIKQPDGNLSVFEYDADDNITRSKDQHHDIKFEYSGLGRMTRRKEGETELKYFYNTEGQLTALLNEKGEQYTFQLDGEGDIIKEVGFDGMTRLYVRDLGGRVQEMLRPSGQLTKYQYDAMGRTTQIQHHDGTVESYSYRPDGSLIGASNQYGSVNLNRNVMGQIISDAQGGNSVQSEYDFMGNRIKVSSSLGADINLQRNAMGDVMNMTNQDWSADFIRDKMGFETERKMGNLKSSFQRDRMGRITEHQVSVGGTTKRSKSYKWGYNDRLHEILDNSLGLTTFEHDLFGNLASASYGSGKKQLRNPDEVGNLYKTSSRSDRKYSKGGKLLEAEGTKYDYDAEGNLTKKTLGDGRVWHYEWDATGMLQKIVRPDNEIVSFEYDALGRRTKKTFRGISTHWVWDGNTPLHEWTDEKEVTTWLFEEDSFAPMGKLKNEQNFNIVSDYLGTPFEMYDDKGGRVWQGELDSFGAIRDFKGNSLTDCPFRYQGQYEDSETGLYYNRFRYYSPEEGIYISQDPIRLDGGVALYGYVNDLNVYIDPFGLKCKKTSYEAGSRREALREAKRDAGVPQSQQPKVTRTPLDDGKGNRVLDAKGNPVQAREYHYTNNQGKPVVIQEHSLGHGKATPGHGAEPHFNVRPIDNQRTGSVPGTHGHYNFPKRK